MVKLMQQFQMHLRASDGSTYGYRITDADAGGRLVGYESSWVPTGRNPKNLKPRSVYTLAADDSRQFEDADDFIKAYQRQLRDEEFDAADPSLKNNSESTRK